MAGGAITRKSGGTNLPLTLAALLIPGFLFGLGLLLLRRHPRFFWLADASLYPWEFWVILLAGAAATCAGAADWRYHRSGKTAVGGKEHRSEMLALGAGGLPLFALMAAASVIERPQILLLPALAVAIFTVVLICYDEFVFHRKRCGLYESVLHRVLVFGMGAAWMAWVHWCFVRGGEL